MASPPLRATKGTFGPGKWNESRRPRGEHLTREEIDALVDAAGKIGRNRLRDTTLIWVGFVHGMRVSELSMLKLEQYELKAGRVTVTRVKNGRTSIHPVETRERVAIRKLVGDRRTGTVFTTERGGPISSSSILKIITRAGKLARGKDGESLISFKVHPHMLRHSCGYWLNEQGQGIRAIQDWLGHKNIRHTERYTALSPKAFQSFKFS
jgi:integrase